jgi:signal transduction histidine kinase
MKKEYLIIILALMFGMLVWIFDSAVDSLFFYEDTFLNLLILDIPNPELFFRFQIIISFAIFGIVISRLFYKQKKAGESLRKLHNDLEKRVENRTKKLSEANEILNSEIAERILVENRLENNQQRLKAVFDGISDPLLLVNNDFQVVMINKSALAYYGVKNIQTAFGKKCHELVSGDLDPCRGCEIPTKSYSHQPTFVERQGLFDPRKTEKVVIYPILGDKGQLENILIRVSDITERKKFESHLVQSEKMTSLGVLVSSIAHEINNPNSFISFNIPILRDYINTLMPIIDVYADEHPDFEVCNMQYTEFRKDILKLLDNVEHGSIRINEFVSKLKDFSQLQNKVKWDWIDLKSVFDNALSITRVQLMLKVKSLINNIPDNLPQIWSDPKALEQILINLLINAAQSSENGGLTIELSVKVNSDWLDHTILEVRDNGCGMDDATIKKIFDPFFTTKSQTKGTGLGLYVCRGLVERLNGRFEIESTPGKGSTFRVVLPDKDQRSKTRL